MMARYGRPSDDCTVLVDVTTLKISRKPVKLQKEVQQDALGKVNKIKEIGIREKTVQR